jgi:hypothetical protein
MLALAQSTEAVAGNLDACAAAAAGAAAAALGSLASSSSSSSSGDASLDATALFGCGSGAEGVAILAAAAETLCGTPLTALLAEDAAVDDGNY